MSTLSPSRIPTWINVLGVVLVVVGLFVGVAGYINPPAAFPNIVVDSPALRMLTAQAAARSLAMALALALGLLSRDQRALGLLFIMRALTETQDMLIIATTGNVPAPPVAVVAGFVLLFIGPEVLAALTLLRGASQARLSARAA